MAVKRSFKQAKNYRRGRRGETRFGLNVQPGTICAIVLHSMESSEKGETAENVQGWFASANAPMASAHKNFDSNSIAESVRVEDEAFHAPPASRWAIGYEQAGMARQTVADWHDPFSWAMLRIVAVELAADCARHRIPLVRRSPDELRAGRINGVYQHDDVSKAWRQSDHWDCGPGYPIDEIIAMAAKGTHTVKPPEATTVMKQGDRGAGVAFLADMVNILAPVRINARGEAGGSILRVPTTKSGRNAYVYDKYVREAVAEVQRFGAAMAKLAGQPPVKVDGIAGKQTAAIIAFWVPIILAQKR
jgi:hypothetical protein